MLNLLFPKQAAKRALNERVKARKLGRIQDAKNALEYPDNWGMIRQRGTL